MGPTKPTCAQHSFKGQALNSSKRNNSQTALTELLLVEIDRSDSDIETAR
jgi:hypothetical protein